MNLSALAKDFAALVGLLLPTIIGVVAPGAAPLANLIVGGISDVEGILGAKTGASKKAVVLASVSSAVAQINQAKGSVVMDPATTATEVGSAIDLGISIVNAIQGKVAVVPAPAVPSVS